MALNESMRASGSVAPGAPPTESLLNFGSEGQLSGVLTRPPQGVSPSQVGVLLFNAGVVHRIGPHRLNVKWARALSQDGHVSLRMDLSGQGDSQMPEQPKPRQQQVLDDLRHGVDQLVAAGAEQVAVIGICSAAMHGLAAAGQDPRIAGLLMIDGHAFPTRWTTLHYHWRRARARGWWASAGLAWAAWRAGQATSGVPSHAAEASVEVDPIAQPSRESFARSLQALTARGLAIRMIYTATWSRFYSYARQFHDVFGREPFASKVQVQFMPEVDHTLTTQASQAESLQAVRRWMRAWPAVR
jgi:hypothetical protein